MYITYETKQFVDNGRGASNFMRHAQKPKRIPTRIPKPEFMPTWLVRTCDMEVVPGCSVEEGYCTLSYSWNQSGDVLKDKVTGEYQRVDEGKHKIVFPSKRSRRKTRGRKRISRKVKFVTFEVLLQQLCKDFNIKYLWYDQMCVYQNDLTKRQLEIRNMHLIYSSAYCTVALVPEYQTGKFSATTEGVPRHYPDYATLITSEWLNRLWTLEETLVSQRLLFVGRSVHTWWYTARKHDILDALCVGLHQWDVTSILRLAHVRHTTLDHDRVFALANLFPDIIESITFHYKQPVMDLLHQFYGLLAMKDLSILCFGLHAKYNIVGKRRLTLPYTDHIPDTTISSQEYKDIPINEFPLPSWTGTTGEYVDQKDAGGPLKTTFRHYSLNGSSMILTCTDISIDPCHKGDAFTLSSDDLPPNPFAISGTRYLAISVQFPSHHSKKNVLLGPSTQSYAMDLPYFASRLRLLSHFMPIKKENLFWCDPTSPSSSYTCFSFSLTEQDYETSQYAVLSGVQFFCENTDKWRLCPVVRKDDEHYKAIGICKVENIKYFLEDIIIPEKTFIIK